MTVLLRTVFNGNAFFEGTLRGRFREKTKKTLKKAELRKDEEEMAHCHKHQWQALKGTQLKRCRECGGAICRKRSTESRVDITES